MNVANAAGDDNMSKVVPQSFRLAVQQLINDCERHIDSSDVRVSPVPSAIKPAGDYIEYC